MVSLRSVITRQVLGYFFLHPQSELYLNEISRRFGLDRGNLVRKLAELEQKGLLKSELRGNQRYYSLNSRYPFLREYKAIILKTVGIENEVKQVFSKIRGVESVYIFGSYAKDQMDAGSDIDILVVGDCPHLAVEKAIAELQKKTDRAINTVDFGKEEFNKRLHDKDSFLTDILKNNPLKVI